MLELIYKERFPVKRVVAGAVFAVCAFALVGWGSAHGENRDREKGDRQADKTRQGNDEDIKRTQGDESGRRSIHEQGSLQNDERGRW